MTPATATSVRHVTAPGSAPGLLTGDTAAPPAVVRITEYDPAHLTERELTDLDQLATPPVQGLVRWVDVTGVKDVATLERLGAVFDVHPLVIEDIVNVPVRPKSELYGNHQFVIVRAPMVGAEAEASFRQVALLVGRRYVLSFQEGPEDLFAPVRDRLRAGRPRIRGAGADYLAYALIDTAIDHGFPAIEAASTRSDELEQIVLESYEPEVARDLHKLRTSLLTLRRAVWPMRDVMTQLLHEESPFFGELTHPFLRDCHDHVIQLIDLIEIHREQARGLMDMHLSGMSNRMNEIMKVLTLMASVFIPLTFVAGIYGMNFQYMPELHAEWGYPIALGTMVAIAIGMMALFRRWGWIGGGRR